MKDTKAYTVSITIIKNEQGNTSKIRSKVQNNIKLKCKNKTNEIGRSSK